MDLFMVAQAAVLIVAGFATATAAVLFASAMDSGPRRSRAASVTPEIAFLFDGDTLVDASASARRLLDAAWTRGDDMTRLVAFLAPRFPDLQEKVAGCGGHDRIGLLSADGQTRLQIDAHGRRLRLGIYDLGDDPANLPDRYTMGALMDELETYRQIGARSPVPVWRQSPDGRVRWANGAYLDLAERLQEGVEAPVWPPRALFADLIDAPPKPDIARRVQLDLPDEAATRWYDCQATRIDGDLLITAVPADRVVTAERNLRDFVQTLTLTFAHLSVGLAIFDRKRELTLFNPALVDLMAISTEFLTRRPTLTAFLDNLRDRQMMPEPKDYKSWRQLMSALEAAAVNGSYSETWALADGRTFRVTGRPHPDGAVAFLFEDISAEISVSRRFRSDIEIAQSVIDGLDEAIAVFSRSGILTMSNRAYASLWGHGASSETGLSFLEATRHWQRICTPSPVWGDARDFASSFQERSNWTAEVRLCDGRRLGCRFETLPGGATLAGFSRLGGMALAPAQPARRPISA